MLINSFQRSASDLVLATPCNDIDDIYMLFLWRYSGGNCPIRSSRERVSPSSTSVAYVPQYKQFDINDVFVSLQRGSVFSVHGHLCRQTCWDL